MRRAHAVATVDGMQMNPTDAFQWDVVVVGASFAGAACALAARQCGLRVCVLERKRDPGIRLHTTGIIVKEAAETTWLGRMPRELTHRVERVRLYAPNLRSLSLHSPGLLLPHHRYARTSCAGSPTNCARRASTCG